MTKAIRALGALALFLGCGLCFAQTTGAAEPASTPYSRLPLRRESDDTSSAPWAGVVALLAVGVGAYYVVAKRKGWPLPRIASRSPTAARRVVQRKDGAALTAQASVHVVEWNGEEFLLGASAAGVTLIARRAASTEPANLETKNVE